MQICQFKKTQSLISNKLHIIHMHQINTKFTL